MLVKKCESKLVEFNGTRANGYILSSGEGVLQG